MRIASIALLSLTLGASGASGAPGASGAAPPEDTLWIWTAREQQQLKRLERKVHEQGDFYRLTEGSWFVETPGSPRLAAELSLFMDLMEQSVLELLGEKKRVRAVPSVKVFSTEAEFSKKSQGARGAAFRFFSRSEYIGPGQTRVRIVENHLYTYLPSPDARSINDLDLARLRGEAARAMAVHVVGKQSQAYWFEQGLTEFFSSFDLHAGPKQRFSARRNRSRGMNDIRRKLEWDAEWNPPLGPILTLKVGERLSDPGLDTIGFGSLSESIVDVLLTNRKAAKLRATLIKGLARAAAGGSGGKTFGKRDLKRLQSIWRTHLKSVLLEEE